MRYLSVTLSGFPDFRSGEQAMPKVKLTGAILERLKAPATGQADYFDAGYPGLALRVTAKGVSAVARTKFEVYSSNSGGTRSVRTV